MTALAAYVCGAGHDRGSSDAAACCARMLDGQTIYGHASRCRSLGPAALGRRLWATLPEDAHDQGPLSGGDGRFLLCADVRLDNRDELAAALALPGPLRETSDAAIVHAAYARWGRDAFARLYGSFAIMIWDEGEQSLTLVRDIMGERPLHYHLGAGFVAAASMPKGLHALSSVPYAAHDAAMADFLALLPETGTESFFAGIERVLPGDVTVIDRQGRVTSTPYWQPPEAPLDFARDSEYVDAARAALDAAVACRLRRAGGGIGTHLSAGLDSSGVTATAARLAAPDQVLAFTAAPLRAFACPPNRLGDESSLAAAVAAQYANITHCVIRAGDRSPLDGFDRHFRVYERPILNSVNALWHDAINDAAEAGGVSVLLTGQMGNLTLSHAGLQQLNMLLRAGSGLALARLIGGMRRHGVRWRGIGAQLFGPHIPLSLWQWLARRHGLSSALGEYSALRADAFTALAVGARADERGLDLAYRPWTDSRAMRLWVLRRVDFGVYIKGTLAGWGLDMRDPTADRRLIELCLRIPERQFSLNGALRSLARRVLADRLPAALVSERRQGAQGTDWPLAVAVAMPAMTEELDALERNPQARALIDLSRLRQAQTDWPHVDPSDPVVGREYASIMFRALAAGHFLRKVGRTN